MIPLPLQSELDCYVSQGDKLDCVLTDATGAVGGEAVFGLLVGGAFLVSLHQASDGSYAIPAVALTLVGGLLVPMLLGGYAAMARTIIILGLATAIFGGMVRFVITTN